MSARPSSETPELHLLPRDVLANGELMLFRNPKGTPFTDRDAWELSAPWSVSVSLVTAHSRLLRQESDLMRDNAFAWDPRFGYLSPFPEHAGTGLLARADLHLEGLHLMGDLPAVLGGIEAVRFRAEGVNMDGLKNAAHIFNVFSTAALGIPEEEFLRRAQALFEDLVTQELNARRRLVQELPRIFADSVSRALAILRNCRLLSPWELLDILSPLRLAAQMDFLTGLTREEADVLIRRQLAARDNLPDTADGDRLRDKRDATLADRTNRRFARVGWNARAQEYFS